MHGADPSSRVLRYAHHEAFNARREQAATLAALFRAPSARVLSAFHYGRHAWGMPQRARDALLRGARTPASFARWPGIAGCATRMLNMCGCAAARVDAAAGPTPARDRLARGGGGGDDDDDGNSTERWDCSSDFDEPLAARRASARAAARHVAAMGFVGLTELHNASVCLFHRRFGGAPRDDEFAWYRAGRGRRDAAGAAGAPAGNRALNRVSARAERCLLYTSPSPRDRTRSRMPSSA